LVSLEETKKNRSGCSQELEKCTHCEAVDFPTEGETPIRRVTAYQSTCSLFYPLGIWLAGGGNPPIAFCQAATCTLTCKWLLDVNNA